MKTAFHGRLDDRWIEAKHNLTREKNFIEYIEAPISSFSNKYNTKNPI